jgi:dTDP-4-dehydrorhamnose reductase
VTGASGFLGRALVARAAAAGWAVAGTVRTRPEAVPRAAVAPEHVHVLDVRDAAAVRAVVAAVAPDAIVHTAYVQSGDAAHAVNAGGAGHVAAAAAAAGARLVHVSSDAIFAGDGDRPLREEDAAAPVTAYGATKAAAEVAVRAALPEALLARTSLLIGGPGHEPSPHERLALAVAAGERELAFYDDEVRSPIQVDDLAAALLQLAARRDVHGPLHVGGADALSRLELARLVVAGHGGDAGRLIGAPAPPDRPRFCPLDSSRAQALVGVCLRGARTVYGAAGSVRGHRGC